MAKPTVPMRPTLIGLLLDIVTRWCGTSSARQETTSIWFTSEVSRAGNPGSPDRQLYLSFLPRSGKGATRKSSSNNTGMYKNKRDTTGTHSCMRGHTDKMESQYYVIQLKSSRGHTQHLQVGAWQTIFHGQQPPFRAQPLPSTLTSQNVPSHNCAELQERCARVQAGFDPPRCAPGCPWAAFSP